MSSFRTSIPASRRARERRRVQQRILVLCGAAQTEKQYFEGLRNERRKSNIVVKVRVETSDPLNVVRAAVKHRNADRDVFDDYWVVLDKDEFDIDQAIGLAEKEGILVALSTPCFEYWLLLHFCDHNAHLSAYRQVVPLLKKHVGDYDKKSIDFKAYSGRVEDAVQRAGKRWSVCGGQHRNPSTSVHELVRHMI
ncbi:RloB family protein [Kitasatospora sp. NPDC002551]|uniref:RloB family protein n=1 Tax=unclassified Kitasatospora TaxID=2633591 RepID=UPI0033340960